MKLISRRDLKLGAFRELAFCARWSLVCRDMKVLSGKIQNEKNNVQLQTTIRGA